MTNDVHLTVTSRAGRQTASSSTTAMAQYLTLIVASLASVVGRWNCADGTSRLHAWRPGVGQSGAAYFLLVKLISDMC